MGENVLTVSPIDEARLRAIYYEHGHHAAFSTAARLYDAVDRTIPKKVIAQWLKCQLAFTLHKSRRLKFKRGFYNVSNINSQWQADLIEIRSLADDNDGYNYILLVVDTFSKFVRVQPLRTKTAKEVLLAFKLIVADAGDFPTHLLHDAGKEFCNNLMTQYLDANDVRHSTPSSDTFKCGVAERCIKSFKELLFKGLTATLKYRYIDFLQKIAQTMNNRFHKSINMAPRDVNPENILQVWNFMHKNQMKKKGKSSRTDIKVNDYVRVSKNKCLVMDKGFLPNWSDRIYKVVGHHPTNPHIFKLSTNEGEVIDGFWYRPEIQPVSGETLFRIDKILKRRTRRGIKEVLVLWKGHNLKEASWIPAANIV